MPFDLMNYHCRSRISDGQGRADVPFSQRLAYPFKPCYNGMAKYSPGWEAETRVVVVLT